MAIPSFVDFVLFETSRFHNLVSRDVTWDLHQLNYI